MNSVKKLTSSLGHVDLEGCELKKKNNIFLGPVSYCFEK